MQKLKKFLTLSPQEKTIFLQAWFQLGYMRAAILTTSFKRLTANLNHHRTPLLPQPISPEQQACARRTGYLVAAAASATPWQSLCLVQVLVAQRLLAKKNIPGQFYLGVEKPSENAGETASDNSSDNNPDNTPDNTPPELAAHAWLDCGGEIVNGGSDCDRFTVISAFSWSQG